MVSMKWVFFFSPCKSQSNSVSIALSVTACFDAEFVHQTKVRSFASTCDLVGGLMMFDVSGSRWFQKIVFYTLWGWYPWAQTQLVILRLHKDGQICMLTISWRIFRSGFGLRYLESVYREIVPSSKPRFIAAADCCNCNWTANWCWMLAGDEKT